MENQTTLIEVLNDLIEINHDRVVGYDKAIEQTQDVDIDLKAIFATMASNSKKYAAELAEEVNKLGGEPAEGTTNRGKVYRVWMDIKKAFATNDRQAILTSCEFGESAAQSAYDEALASDAEISATLRILILAQKDSLQTDQTIIKKYTDLHKAANA